MPFVKLDCGILKSTLWMDRECREVFITALLMAEPRELEEPTKQIEVRTLNYTGFVIPPGWYGFADAAGIGIVRQAVVPDDVGMAALERLGAPDPESRSQDFDGRRLIRVDGGYVVLNYMRYREHDYNAAARMRRYRQRKAQKAIVTGNSHAETGNVPSNVTHAEAESRSREEAPAAAAPPRAKKVNQDPAWLLDFKLAYPARGGDPGWRAAVRAAHARIREGHTSVQFIEGAQRYAAYIAATGKTGTEFVKQAATFLGPDKPFLLSWDPPARTNGLDPAAETVWNELVASNGTKRDDRVQRAIEAVGGWLRIQLRTAFDSPLIKREFCAAWVSASVGSRANGGHT
jgi:hypothetical protein